MKAEAAPIPTTYHLLPLNHLGEPFARIACECVDQQAAYAAAGAYAARGYRVEIWCAGAFVAERRALSEAITRIPQFRLSK